jgi:hypothetical protein
MSLRWPPISESRVCQVVVPVVCQTETTDIERWPDAEEIAAHEDRSSWPSHVKQPCKRQVSDSNPLTGSAVSSRLLRRHPGSARVGCQCHPSAPRRRRVVLPCAPKVVATAVCRARLGRHNVG